MRQENNNSAHCYPTSGHGSLPIMRGVKRLAHDTGEILARETLPTLKKKVRKDDKVVNWASNFWNNSTTQIFGYESK